jgi:hypothetical protein
MHLELSQTQQIMLTRIHQAVGDLKDDPVAVIVEGIKFCCRALPRKCTIVVPVTPSMAILTACSVAGRKAASAATMDWPVPLSIKDTKDGHTAELAVDVPTACARHARLGARPPLGFPLVIRLSFAAGTVDGHTA